MTTTATVARSVVQTTVEQQYTIIRKVRGEFKFVTVRESQLTADERRAIYCTVNSIYA